MDNTKQFSYNDYLAKRQQSQTQKSCSEESIVPDLYSACNMCYTYPEFPMFFPSPLGNGGVIKFEDLTPEQILMLKGKDGEDSKVPGPPGQSIVAVKAVDEENALLLSIGNPNNIYYW